MKKKKMVPVGPGLTPNVFVVAQTAAHAPRSYRFDPYPDLAEVVAVYDNRDDAVDKAVQNYDYFVGLLANWGAAALPKPGDILVVTNEYPHGPMGLYPYHVMGIRRNPQRNPKPALDLTDCPVLQTPVWTEEDVLVALDWAMEHGLIDDVERWLVKGPGDALQWPMLIRLAFLENRSLQNAWEEYRSGRHQAADDAAHAPRGLDEVRQQLIFFHQMRSWLLRTRQVEVPGGTHYRYAFVQGYTDWAREHGVEV